MASSAPALTVLYATETGNAEDIAQRIAQIAYRHHVSVSLCNLADYDRLALVDETHVVFVVSTTGHGEFPSPARAFWRFLLRKGLPDDILSDMTFTTFGLGDSVYTRFCWASRMLNRRLRNLGAVEWFERGEADEQHELGLEGGLQPWLDTFTRRVRDDLMPRGREPIPADTLLPPRVAVSLSDAPVLAPAPPSGALIGTLERNERMTAAAHFQDVRRIEITLPDDAPPYQAGDVASFLPENAPEDIEALLQRLGWADVADQRLELTPADANHALPPALAQASEAHTLTLRRLLTQFLDPLAVPRRSFFDLLQHFTPRDHMEHEKIVEFLQPGDGTDDMYEYAQRVRRTMLEVLVEFKSVQVPVSYVMDLFPLMRPRAYSIASAPSVHPRTIQLAVAVVHYKTRLQKPRVGTASTWLARLRPGAQVPLRLQNGTLLLPAQPSVPIIAIGPGTGIAPLRALVQERLAHRGGEHLVIAGCRYLERDCLFRSEWEAWARGEIPRLDACAADGPTPRLTFLVAASRDQSDKVYVQDMVRQQGARIWDVLGAQRGVAYLCGSSGKMPEQVRDAILAVFQEHGGMDAEQAARFFAALEVERRWQEECW
ncbi:NAPDH-dependent diflavin reductase [Malassezia caprae]|uniref:NADPH-dependent diflavin oxidoreductase 1 n=1 Tax=Malassezia caprae TaxID=1381934 RepID=A0AAF0E3R8_9BASI|nr:NAPDH-dependent diflavin reductase [Malassezia caprae]